ncbi:lysM and putative peptidoglycan-binding domain-containing protein 3-like [Physella acuta]|uniref:lysM and putative peptidoglycan-binding domain-containing protein 3-like n=1 Tax=Physella acuta TaxID=109671 RepID=UPI0027DD8BE6|nr:lysM and putative peptidoglycan-binding domain-containing protein 3-like [Physella acuta]
MASYIRGVSQPLPVRSDYKKLKQSDRLDGHTSKTNKNYHGNIPAQNVKAARVYLFGDSVAEEDDDNVEYEMRSRHKKGATYDGGLLQDQPQYFEKEIIEGETLQAIALRYACQVSEIKRINNLIQDQEFYGLKVIKVPMTRFGVLSEQFSRGNNRLKSSRFPSSARENENAEEVFLDNHFDDTDSQHDFSDPDTQLKILRTLSIRENFSAEGKEAEKFLNKMDEDLKKFKQSSHRPERESLTEVISVLTNKSIHPLMTNRPKKSSGADCGLSWWSIIIISLTVTIILPSIGLIYYFFYYHSHS